MDRATERGMKKGRLVLAGGAAVSLLLWVIFVLQGHCGAGETVIDEQFEDLSEWTPVLFRDIERHSDYRILSGQTGSFLVARSSNSASGIKYSRRFDVYTYPVVSWRWKVDNVYAGGNVEMKSGDDYPLRVYVTFAFDPEKASFSERLKYGLARTWYGEYPPHSTLNYIWANRFHDKDIYQSTYTDRAKLVILQSGNGKTGQWVQEKVDVLKDYQRAFGEKPPQTASLAIMNDSDNTGESSVSYLDYIRVMSRE